MGRKKKIDVGLINVGYESIYKKLLSYVLPLNKNQQKQINEFIKSITLTEEQINSKYQNYYSEREMFKYEKRKVYYVAFVQKWKEKLLYRVFAIRRFIDRRKKGKERQTFTILEIFRSLENHQKAICFSTVVSNNMGWTIITIFEDEKNKNDLCCHFYKNYDDVGNWRYVDHDYVDGFIDKKMYSVDDLITLVPELKYSMISLEDNLIYYYAYFIKYPEIEMLKKCGFYKLLKSQRCLNRLKKGDKTFMKFLYKCYEKKYTEETYETYLGYYKKNGFDFSKWKNYQMYIDFKNKLFEMRMFESEYFYNGEKRSFLFDSLNLEKLSEYLIKQNSEFYYYIDYLSMCNKLELDLNLDYVLYPKELSKRHDELSQILKIRREEKLKDEFLIHLETKSLLEFEEKDYKFYLPTSFQDFYQRADTLNQCLISCGYDKRYLSGNCIILFIDSLNDSKVSNQFTLELDLKLRIVQLHGFSNDINCSFEQRKNLEIVRSLIERRLNLLKIENGKIVYRNNVLNNITKKEVINV